jgi:hypothetical protein
MRRPSPALVIAVLALAGLWGGPAVARSLIHGSDIAADTVTGRNVKDLSGRDVVSNGIDGSDIDEASLDQVPSAIRAERATAVNGVRFSRFAYADPTGATKTFFTGGGLRVRGLCNNGNLEVTAAPATAGGLIRVAVTTPATGTRVESDNDFTPGELVDLLPGSLNDASGTLTFYTPGGQTLTITYLAQDELPAGTGHQCVIAGTAVLAKK